MSLLSSTRERIASLAAALVAIAALIVILGAAPATAARGQTTAPNLLAAPPGDIDDEGGTATLREQLDAASKGYLDAKAALTNSTKRQQALAAHLSTLETELTARTQTVNELAGAAYRTGRLSMVSALLNSRSPDGLVDRASALGAVAVNENRELRKLNQIREQETRAKAALDNEVREQKKQVEVMAKRRQQAERALAVANSGAATAGVKASSNGRSPSAKPAPRNPDSSWPSESCSITDPTTSGCITPRTLHALNQAKAAGFTRYVSCFRSGGSGEHPKGRACDFAAQKGGFGGVATGGDRTYGDNLAAYFIRNADNLGVLYVIWFKQIWLPSSGWRAYNGGGDPASDHTNHVHLSVY